MSADRPSRRQLELRLKACQDALARRPSDPQRVQAVGSVLLDLGRVDEAVTCFRQAAALALGGGRTAEAAEVCRRILSVLPGDEEAAVLLHHLTSQLAPVPTAVQAPAGAVSVRGGPTDLIPAGEHDPTRESELPPPRSGLGGLQEAKTDVDLDPGARFAAMLSAGETARAGGQPPARSGRSPDEATVKAPSPAGLRRQRRRSSRVLLSPSAERPDGAAPLAAPARRPVGRRDPSPAAARMAAAAVPAGASERPAVTAAWPAPGEPASPRRGPLLPAELVAAGESRRFERDQYLFREGECGSELFVLRQGRVELSKWERTPRRCRIDNLDVGACFGELALFGDGLRHLSCRALSAVEVVAIPRQRLREAMASTPGLERQLRGLYRDRLQEILLRTSPFFSTMPDEEARATLRRFKPLGLKSGQVVVEQGAPAPGLFLVLLGSLRVFCRPSPIVDAQLLAVLRDGDLFGEMSLLRERPAAATVETVGFVQLLHLALGECHRVLSTRPELVERLEALAQRRERANRAILRGAAYFDEERGAVVYHQRR